MSEIVIRPTTVTRLIVKGTARAEVQLRETPSIVRVVQTASPFAIGGGGSDPHYVHTQSAAATRWTVNHNFGKYPAVTLLTVGGIELVGTVTHTSVNQFTVDFDTAQAGTAIVR